MHGSSMLQAVAMHRINLVQRKDVLNLLSNKPYEPSLALVLHNITHCHTNKFVFVMRPQQYLYHKYSTKV